MTGLQLVRAIVLGVLAWAVLAVVVVLAVIAITAVSGGVVDLVARAIVAG